MRKMPILSAVFVTAATSVFAQVTIDLHALQALPERPQVSHPAHQPPLPSRPPVSVREGSSTARGQSESGQSATPTQAAPLAPLPVMPEIVPDTAAITPITPPPPLAGSAPPPVSNTATTTAAQTAAGLRLTFAPGQSDLSPESAASIKQLAGAATTGAGASGDGTTFNVSAYAPGKPDDPSTARRMSLARAMAVRSALVADGVASARIFVRALGEQHGDGPADRVDVNVLGANAPDPANPR